MVPSCHPICRRINLRGSTSMQIELGRGGGPFQGLLGSNWAGKRPKLYYFRSTPPLRPQTSRLVSCFGLSAQTATSGRHARSFGEHFADKLHCLFVARVLSQQDHMTKTLKSTAAAQRTQSAKALSTMMPASLYDKRQQTQKQSGKMPNLLA
jgi:hypothetical protein